MTLSLKSSGTDEVRQVRLRRRLIRIPPVRHQMLERGIGCLRIVNFQNSTSREVRKALGKMFRSVPGGLKGLILDLRGNPGGLFDQAIAVADLFLREDVITRVQGRGERMNREFRAEPRGTFPRIPMVVLIDRGTASAAEILAGALEGRPDVIIMGEPSFGKASVQGIFPIPGGRALRLTTAHYYTPDGRDIDGRGIEPDVEIAQPRNLDSNDELSLEQEDAFAADEGVKQAVRKIFRLRRSGRSPFGNLY